MGIKQISISVHHLLPMRVPVRTFAPHKWHAGEGQTKETVPVGDVQRRLSAFCNPNKRCCIYSRMNSYRQPPGLPNQ